MYTGGGGGLFVLEAGPSAGGRRVPVIHLALYKRLLVIRFRISCSSTYLNYNVTDYVTAIMY
jgi:hypothetical protein